MKGENKKKLPKTGFKIWGHRSHLSGNRADQWYAHLIGKNPDLKKNWLERAKESLGDLYIGKK